MAEGHKMTAADLVDKLMRDDHADVLRDSVAWLVAELDEAAELAVLPVAGHYVVIGAALLGIEGRVMERVGPPEAQDRGQVRVECRDEKHRLHMDGGERAAGFRRLRRAKVRSSARVRDAAGVALDQGVEPAQQLRKPRVTPFGVIPVPYVMVSDLSAEPASE
jgi:hypothetical protein